VVLLSFFADFSVVQEIQPQGTGAAGGVGPLLLRKPSFSYQSSCARLSPHTSNQPRRMLKNVVLQLVVWVRGVRSESGLKAMAILKAISSGAVVLGLVEMPNAFYALLRPLR
jgi:hypothetical protein